MGRPVTPEAGMLASHKIDMSHQEMTRLLDKLEELWEGCKCAGHYCSHLGIINSDFTPCRLARVHAACNLAVVTSCSSRSSSSSTPSSNSTTNSSSSYTTDNLSHDRGGGGRDVNQVLPSP